MKNHKEKIAEIWGYELPFYFDNADIDAAINHHFGGSLIRLISYIDGIPDIEELFISGEFRENPKDVKFDILCDLIETAVGQSAPSDCVIGGPTKIRKDV